MILNPKTETFDHLDDTSREIMLKTIAFFEAKGKQSVMEDYNQSVWYQDFLDFVKENKVFSTLLTPAAYGGENKNCRWDTSRISDFSELMGFYGMTYWYTWQVTILGLGPIWMGENEEVKKKTAQMLDDGGIFAFGLSEKEHGADLYSSDMAITPLGNGNHVADGGKYYIGNANEASYVSTFAKDSETDEYVWFVAEPTHPNYDLIKNTVPWSSYVAEYGLNGYPVSDAEILTRGSIAWDSALNTINVGKFNLGWGAVGTCEHAFYEALNHAAHRNLYGKFVTDFPHIKALFVDYYTRLVAMRLFSRRAVDYMRTASPEDRRYLLYNPLVKMKVTTEGEQVINDLWDVIAAKGMEKDTFFMMATQDIRKLPKLEGTVHVNMALVIKFMANFLFKSAKFPEIPARFDPADDEFLFNQGPTKGLGSILFHDYNIAYNSVDLVNVDIFKEQIALLKRFLLETPPTKEQSKDIDFLLSLGELFTMVAYGQLIIEKANMVNLDPDLLNQIFDIMIRDFSKYGLQIYSKPSSSPEQMEMCLEMIKKPVVDMERFQRVLSEYVYKEIDSYEMNA